MIKVIAREEKCQGIPMDLMEKAGISLLGINLPEI